MIKIDAYDLATYVQSQRGGPLLTIMDEVRDYVFIKDLEGRFLYSNRAHLAHLGRTEAEVLGKNDFDLFPAHLAESFFSGETRMFETREAVIRLQQSLDARGERFYSTAIKILIGDSHGNALGLIGTVHRFNLDSRADFEQCKSRIMSILRLQHGVTPCQLAAFEASLPTMLEIS